MNPHNRLLLLIYLIWRFVATSFNENDGSGGLIGTVSAASLKGVYIETSEHNNTMVKLGGVVNITWVMDNENGDNTTTTATTTTSSPSSTTLLSTSVETTTTTANIFTGTIVNPTLPPTSTSSAMVTTSTTSQQSPVAQKRRRNLHRRDSLVESTSTVVTDDAIIDSPIPIPPGFTLSAVTESPVPTVTDQLDNSQNISDSIDSTNVTTDGTDDIFGSPIPIPLAFTQSAIESPTDQPDETPTGYDSVIDSSTTIVQFDALNNSPIPIPPRMTVSSTDSVPTTESQNLRRRDTASPPDSSSTPVTENTNTTSPSTPIPPSQTLTSTTVEIHTVSNQVSSTTRAPPTTKTSTSQPTPAPTTISLLQQQIESLVTSIQTISIDLIDQSTGSSIPLAIGLPISLGGISWKVPVSSHDGNDDNGNGNSGWFWNWLNGNSNKNNTNGGDSGDGGDGNQIGNDTVANGMEQGIQILGGGIINDDVKVVAGGWYRLRVVVCPVGAKMTAALGSGISDWFVIVE
ncbi:hypothetical protein HDU76_012228 [Blyttiomyces sp. JEL0837]|nr:hypothetical protein HDU76_012228 [Blyttiomyces sp. JEL0837]